MYKKICMSIVATCVDLVLAQISCVFYLFKIFLALIVWDLFHDTLLLKLFWKYFCDMKIKIPTYILELDIRFISKKMYLEQVLTHDYCLMMMM